MNEKSEITIKEVYKRILQLEAKFDARAELAKFTNSKFYTYAFWIVFFVVANTFLTIVSIYLNLRL